MPFSARPRANALGFKPPLVTRIARTGLGSRLFQDIKRSNRCFRPCMSSYEQTTSYINVSVIGNLKRAFRAVLLQISRSLEKDQQEELRFYYKELIVKGNTGVLSILSSLEDAGKISWSDVSFLKEGLREVRRLDLENNLTEYEIKRNLTVLLHSYSRKRQGMEPSPQLAPDIADNADKVTGYLLIIMTNIERHGFDVSKEVRSLVETREDIENLMLEFEDISDQKLSESWSKLTLLTVISGEIVADLALANEEHRQKQEMKLLSTLTEHLYFLILRLGSWVS